MSATIIRKLKMLYHGKGRHKDRIIGFKHLMTELDDYQDDLSMIASAHHIYDTSKNENGYDNTLVVGDSNTGKTTGFVKPNILNKQEDISYVVIDRDGSLKKETCELARELGYRVEYMNPYDIENTQHYNPINNIYHYSDEYVKDIARSFCREFLKGEDTWWFRPAEMILSVILLYMKRNYSVRGHRPEDILNYLIEMLETIKDESTDEVLPERFREYYNYAEKTGYREYVELCKIMILDNSKEYLIPILQMMINGFMILNSDTSKKLTDCDGVKVYKLFNFPTIVYIGFSKEDDTYNFLSRMLLEECIREIDWRYENHGKKTLKHVRFMLDDFLDLGVEKIFPEDSRIGRKPLDSLLSMARFRNTSYQLCARNIEQIIKACGKMAQGILMCTDVLICTGTTNHMTAEYISKNAGEIPDKNVDGLSKVPVVARDILDMPEDTEVILTRDQKAIFDKKYA